MSICSASLPQMASTIFTAKKKKMLFETASSKSSWIFLFFVYNERYLLVTADWHNGNCLFRVGYIIDPFIDWNDGHFLAHGENSLQYREKQEKTNINFRIIDALHKIIDTESERQTQSMSVQMNSWRDESSVVFLCNRLTLLSTLRRQLLTNK